MAWQSILEISILLTCVLLQIIFIVFFTYNYQRLEVQKSWDKNLFIICFSITVLILISCAIFLENSLDIYPIYLLYSFSPFHLVKIGTNSTDYSNVFSWLLPLIVAFPLIMIGFEFVGLISRNLNKFISLSFAVTFFSVSEIIYIVYYFRRISNGIRNMGVWANLNSIIDNLYRLILFGFIVCLIYFYAWESEYSIILYSVLTLLITGQYGALIFRKTKSRIYVFWKKQENKILEAIKSSLIQINNEDTLNPICRDLYERVLDFVKGEKAFLNGNLSIDDVAKHTFTNKVYVSKAINKYSGKNFCQFVNYFRIQHSLEVFDENPHLTVTQMALLSGFHSPVSFNTSFKLYMNESPSEWCRRRKPIILKKKK